MESWRGEVEWLMKSNTFAHWIVADGDSRHDDGKWYITTG